MIERVIEARRHLEQTQAASASRDRRALSRELRSARSRKSDAAAARRRLPRYRWLSRRRATAAYELESDIIELVLAALSD